MFEMRMEAIEEIDCGNGRFGQSRIRKSAEFESNRFFILAASFSDNVSFRTFK